MSIGTDKSTISPQSGLIPDSLLALATLANAPIDRVAPKADTGSIETQELIYALMTFRRRMVSESGCREEYRTFGQAVTDVSSAAQASINNMLSDQLAEILRSITHPGVDIQKVLVDALGKAGLTNVNLSSVIGARDSQQAAGYNRDAASAAREDRTETMFHDEVRDNLVPRLRELDGVARVWATMGNGTPTLWIELERSKGTKFKAIDLIMDFRDARPDLSFNFDFFKTGIRPLALEEGAPVELYAR